MGATRRHRGTARRRAGRGGFIRAYAAAAVLSALLTAPAWGVDGSTVVPAKGWKFRTYLAELPAVDNIAIGADGMVYFTQELAEGKGRLARVRNGKAETVVDGLNRADGLLARGKLLYVTEEVHEGRVLEIHPEKGETRVLAVLHNPEGIGMLPSGELVVSEDAINGRLVVIRRDNGAPQTLVGGFNRPEGLAVAKDGTIYLAETATGRVLAVRDGLYRSVVDDLDEPDQVRLGPDGSLWITEDTRRGRLLQLKDGALNVILSGLDAPQGMAFLPNGALLLAEQGRGRILMVTREEPPPGYVQP